MPPRPVPSPPWRRLGRGCLLAWLLLLPWLGGKMEPWWSLPLHGLAWTAFLLALLEAARRRELLWPPLRWLAPWLLFLAWSGLSAWAGVQWRAGLGEVERLLFLTLWLLALLWLGESGDARRIMVGVGLMGVLVALRGWGEYLATWHRYGDPTWRIFAGFGNPNLAAAYLLLALFLLMGLAMTSSPPRRWAWGAGALIVLGALGLTGSRGGLLAALGGGLVGMALALRHHPLKALGPMVGGGALFGLALLLPTPVGRRLLSEKLLGHSLLFRALTWKATARMALEQPILGFGPGSFPIVFPRFGEAGFTRMAHNTPLQIAAEQGWPALLLWLTWWGTALGAMLQIWRGETPSAQRVYGGALLGAWTAFLLHQGVDYGWYLTAIAGTALALASLAFFLPREVSSPIIPLPRRWRWSPWATLLVAAASLLPLGDAYRAVQGAIWLDKSREARTEEEGLQALERAIRWDPLHPEAWRRLALAEALRGRTEEAERLWTQALQRDRESPHTYHVGSRIAELAGNFYLAFDRNREALRRSPWETLFWMRQAELALRLGQPSLAQASWRRVLEMAQGLAARYNPLPEYVYNPHFGEAALRLAQQAEREGRREEAQKLYAQAIDFLEKALEHERRALPIWQAVGQGSPETLERLEGLLQEARQGKRR